MKNICQECQECQKMNRIYQKVLRKKLNKEICRFDRSILFTDRSRLFIYMNGIRIINAYALFGIKPQTIMDYLFLGDFIRTFKNEIDLDPSLTRVKDASYVKWFNYHKNHNWDIEYERKLRDYKFAIRKKGHDITSR